MSKKEKIEFVYSDSNVALKPIIGYQEKDYVRFWSKAELTANPEKCWNWKGWIASRSKPYGIFSIKLHSYVASRIAYFIYYKQDPLKFNVLHTCDNPRCINPNHLFLGTNDDNIRDKVKKGRQARNIAWNKGKETKFKLWDNPNCKVTKDEFIEIKNLYETGNFSLKELAEKYNSSKKALAAGIRKLGGSVNRYTILTETQVLEIRAKYIKTEYAPNRVIGNISKLSKEYNVGYKTITDIYKRVTWRHL
jgi:hypothetical protein